MAKVVFVTTDGEVNVEVPEGTSLLDAGLNNGVDIEYSCKDGVCGVCQVKILEGEHQLSEPDTDEIDVLFDRIDDGVRLACKAIIHGDVKVKVR